MEIRIRLPDTLAGWRYCLRHPRSFVVGRYGYEEFIRQRDIMMSSIRKRNEWEMKYRQTLNDLIDVRKELSALKREKNKKKGVE
jgi:hypothetical protein